MYWFAPQTLTQEETFMTPKHYLPAVAAILAWTAFTGSASANPTFDNINGGATVYPNLTIGGLNDLGWVYTPTVSYQLSGITSDFSTGETGSQTVTLSFWSGLPDAGGTELASGTFASGAGILGVTFGSDISIVAGDTYFVGLSNTNGIGVDMVQSAFSVTSANPAAPGVTYIPSGFYSDELAATTDFATNIPLIDTSCPGGESCDNAFAAPILNFQGVANSNVPEPGTLAMSATGVVALLLAFSAKRYAASRRSQ
jgi:hypothetical protein